MRGTHSAQCASSCARARSLLAVFVVAAVAASVRADELEIVSPAFGRPAIVAPGDALGIDVIADDVEPTTVELVSVRHADHRYSLAISAKHAGAAGAHRILAKVESSVPEGQYDLEVACASAKAGRPHSVSVRRIGDRLRLAVVGELRVGDPCIPRFDPRLVNEINLRGPDAVVLLGGYIDPAVANSADAWRDLRGELRRLDAAVIAACGATDSLEDFTREFGPSPIGEISIGPHRVMIAYDPPTDPLAENRTQCEWLRAGFARPGSTSGAACVLIGPRPESEAVIRGLIAASPARDGAAELSGVSAQTLPAATLTCIFASVDGRTAAPAAVPDRQVQSIAIAPALLGCHAGAGGFRLFDFGVQHSGPRSFRDIETGVGDVALEYELANDGRSAIVVARLLNRTAREIDGLVLRARVGKTGAVRPWVLGARLVGLADHHEFWEATISADLPPNAMTRVGVGTGVQPAAPRITAAWGGPGRVKLTNEGETNVIVNPLLHCRGTAIAWNWDRPADAGEAPSAADASEIGRTLSAGATVTLRVSDPPQHDPLLVYPLRNDSWRPIVLRPARQSP